MLLPLENISVLNGRKLNFTLILKVIFWKTIAQTKQQCNCQQNWPPRTHLLFFSERARDCSSLQATIGKNLGHIKKSPFITRYCFISSSQIYRKRKRRKMTLFTFTVVASLLMLAIEWRKKSNGPRTEKNAAAEKIQRASL